MKKLFFNGIDGESGEYARAPIDLETMKPLEADGPMEQDAQGRLKLLRRAGFRGVEKWMLSRHNGARAVFRDGSRPQPAGRGIMATLDEDPADLSRVGWGVVFPEGQRQQVRQALKPLLELRRSQVALGSGIYREFEYRLGHYKKGAEFLQFLEEHGVGPGQVDIRKMPYYLLIVGTPQEIPFGFQFQLDAQYAVGRLCFPRWEDYPQYARNVVQSESEGSSRPRRLALFGVQTPGDKATEQTTQDLMGELARLLPGKIPGRLESYLAEDATKARLHRLMGGADTPSVLFTASHAVCFRNGHRLQEPIQGALLCREWPGLKHKPSPEHWMSAEDIGDDADLRGLIAFHFACFTAGTPDQESYFDRQDDGVRLLSDDPFVAAMPQRLLSHPRGALAVIGHVDQAYVEAFLGSDESPQVQAFESALRELMDGKPVGLAMESFGQRYANLAAWLHERHYSENDREGTLRRNHLFMACHDARSYLVAGDPAVRLPMKRPPQAIHEASAQVSSSLGGPKLHALLIGASFYFPRTVESAPAYSTLGGCVTDVEAMNDFLEDRLGVPPERIQMLTASDVGDDQPEEPPDLWPTYQNMVRAIRALTRRAQPGDQVLIHYAGHGGRTPTCVPEQKGERAYDESLVPIDIACNRNSCYLRDVEIAQLLQEMTAKGLLVTLVLDSCHSGGATRGESDVQARGVSVPDMTHRPPGSVASPQDLAKVWESQRPKPGSRGLKAGSGWMPEASGFVLLAACQTLEKAYECSFESGRHGVLTYWLLEALQHLGPDLTYQALHNRILSKVHSRFPAQTPQLEGDGSRIVLGCHKRVSSPSVTVLDVDGQGNRIFLNSGIAQGVRKGALFAIYPRLAQQLSQERPTAVAEVVEAGPVESWAEVRRSFRERAIEPGDQALLTQASVSLRKNVRWLGGKVDQQEERMLLGKFRQALKDEASSFLKLMDLEDERTSHDSAVDFQIHLNRDGEFEIWDASGVLVDLRPALKVHDPETPSRLVARLNSLSRFRNALELRNPAAASSLGGRLTLEVGRLPEDYVDGDELKPRFPSDGPVGGGIEVEAGEWICVRLYNASQASLNVTVLALQSNWAINQVHPPYARHVLLDAGQEELFSLQASLLEGRGQATDVLKAIGAVGSADFRWLEQAALDEPSRSRLPRRGSPTRSAGAEDETSDLEEFLASLSQALPKTQPDPPRMRSVERDALQAIKQADEADSGLTMRVLKAATASTWTATEIEIHIKASNGDDSE